MVHFCGSLPRFNPWTWKIVLGLRLDILLSDCNAACSWEFEIRDMVLIMVKHESSNIARPSTRTALNVPWAFDLLCSFLLDHKCSYVWWFDPRREIKDLGTIPLPHRWCFHPLQLGGKAGNSHFWSLPNHLYTSIVFVIFCYPLRLLYPSVSCWFLGEDTPSTCFRWSCFPFIQLVVLHLAEERCCRWVGNPGGKSVDATRMSHIQVHSR